ncbi:hypothetical protein MKEN_00430200 [Mycena kentingensis (nom. inval.)]|nr:hypothetical protein MKEN_00430200 [Mycena kentingensis (nom. inval.)]
MSTQNTDCPSASSATAARTLRACSGTTSTNSSGRNSRCPLRTTLSRTARRNVQIEQWLKCFALVFRRHRRTGFRNYLVSKFAMNSARSTTTGFSPFYLNSGQTPAPMIWDAKSEYPGVRVFAQRMKDAIMAAHDAIIEARVKQVRQANKHRRAVPFVQNDLVYLSTKNLSIPKNRARKLVPKFVGPYRIVEDYNNGTFKLDLPPELKRRGIHPAFHSSLLRIHIPNDDRRFPGRQVAQVTGIGEGSDEWAVRKIIAHSGKGSDAKFEVEWMNGDTAWFPYKQVEHLSSLADYLQALNASSITHLPIGNGTPPDDAGVYLGTIGIKQGRKFSARTRPYPPSTMGDDYRREWDDAIARQRDDFVGHIFGAAKYALDAAVGKRSRPEEYDPDYREYLAQRQQEGPNYRGPSNRRFNDHYRAHSRPPSHSRYRQDDGHENHRPSRSRVPRFIDSWTPEPERYSSVRYVRPEDEPKNWGYREPTAAGVGNDSDSDDDRSDTEPTQNQPTVEQVTSAVGAVNIAPAASSAGSQNGTTARDVPEDTAPTGTKKADEQPKDAGDKGASVTPTPPTEDDAATTAALPFAGLDTVQVAQESGTSMDTDE